MTIAREPQQYRWKDYSETVSRVWDGPTDYGSFVYVAGPYRAADGRHDASAYAEIDANINLARQWSANLAEEEIPYFCPHLNSAHGECWAPDVPPEYWLDLDFRILQHAWGLLLLPGWRNSQGTLAEKDFANERGMPIYQTSMFEKLIADWFEDNEEEE